MPRSRRRGIAIKERIGKPEIKLGKLKPPKLKIGRPKVFRRRGL